MKKAFLTMALVAVSAAAFAQGKVTAQNSASTQIQLGDINHVRPADAALANQAVPTTGPLPSGIYLDYGLFVGTASGSLQMVTTVPINTASGSGNPAGIITATHVVLPAPFAGGSSYFFQVWVWDAAYANPGAEMAAHPGGDDYLASNSIFTMTPGSSLAYPGVNNGGGSTYASVPLTTGTPSPVPEPATFALAGLGAAALLIFRRRK